MPTFITWLDNNKYYPSCQLAVEAMAKLHGTDVVVKSYLVAPYNYRTQRDRWLELARRAEGLLYLVARRNHPDWYAIPTALALAGINFRIWDCDPGKQVSIWQIQNGELSFVSEFLEKDFAPLRARR